MGIENPVQPTGLRSHRDGQTCLKKMISPAHAGGVSLCRMQCYLCENRWHISVMLGWCLFVFERKGEGVF